MGGWELVSIDGVVTQAPREQIWIKREAITLEVECNFVDFDWSYERNEIRLGRRLRQTAMFCGTTAAWPPEREWIGEALMRSRAELKHGLLYLRPLGAMGSTKELQFRKSK